MKREILRAKIHRATVTHADVDYEGSITIPPDLMELADIKAHEAVHVWNVTQGTRFQTYAIEGEADSRDIAVNGAAAHLVTPGNLVIIACFCQLTDEELANHQPKLIFVDAKNRPLPTRGEIPGPRRAQAS